MANNAEKLAALANELGGIDEVAELLNLDEDLIQSAIEFNELGFYEDNLIANALSSFILDTDTQDIYGINPQQLFEGVAEKIEAVENIIGDSDNAAIFRDLVAQGRFSQDDLDNAFLFFGQGQATPNVQTKIIEYLADNEENANTFLSLFEMDGYRIDDIEDSYFWEWFRETFYE